MDKQHIEDYIQELEEQHPFLARLTDLDRVEPYSSIYSNPQHLYGHDPSKSLLVYLLSVTGGGKNTFVNTLLQTGEFEKVRTATSRSRRQGEPQDSYVFMRPKSAEESDNDYYDALRREYDLVESDVHHGNLYGLPASSLQWPARGKHKVILTEPSALDTIADVAPGYNHLRIFLVPDSWQQIYLRIVAEDGYRDNLMTRLADSARWWEEAPEYAHFFIHNTEDPELLGLDTAVEPLPYVLDEMQRWLREMTKPNIE